jgi:hypothetical protein
MNSNLRWLRSAMTSLNEVLIKLLTFSVSQLKQCQGGAVACALLLCPCIFATSLIFLFHVKYLSTIK